MDNIRQYLISITVSAVIAAIINSLFSEKGGNGTIIKLLTGLFISVAVISPWIKWDLNNMTNMKDDYWEEAIVSASLGEQMAVSSAGELISQKTSAYILDKANSMGLNIDVEVVLNDSNPPQPCGVIITGAVSPYAKEVLGQYITEMLAIPKEDQQWS